MADDLDVELGDEDADGGEKKSGGMLVPILVGLVLAMALGIGAAVAVMTGVAPIPGLSAEEKDENAEKKPEKKEEKKEEAAVFVEFEPLELSIGRVDNRSKLRLKFSIETTATYMPKVEELKPRILDALNTLLRAADARDLVEPRALARLRAQMLRRVRLAADPTAIRDLLVTEYFIY